MLRALLSIVLANVLAFGMDGILRGLFKIHIQYQQWICINIAWATIMAYSRSGRRW